mmetsp:Transcript_6983/g.17841  ORF Transcript_6983/g.17841 Transcript_6983/m.17841 type:complete len:283 (-) Transcript_6983:199-1047(-)
MFGRTLPTIGTSTKMPKNINRLSSHTARAPCRAFYYSCCTHPLLAAAALGRPPLTHSPLGGLEGVGQPLHAFPQPLALDGAGLEDGPLPVLDLRQPQPLRDLQVTQRPGQVLLVGVHQDERVLELLLLQDGVELAAAGADPVHVAAVHHVDDGLRVGVVAAPVGADGRLPAQVPHLELDVLVRHRLHVEADGGDGAHHRAHLQTVQDGGLAGVVQPQHQDARLALAKRRHQAREQDPHGSNAFSVFLPLPLPPSPSLPSLSHRRVRVRTDQISCGASKIAPA